MSGLLPDYTAPSIDQPEPPKAQVGGSHYNKPLQHVDAMVMNSFSYLESQSMKYIWRHAEKNGAEDINKSIHYLLFILKHEYETVDDRTIDEVLSLITR